MGTQRVAIVGAGPCGIACGLELAALECREFVILEGSDIPGGLASSRLDPAGFTWDRGGHVVFSHYGEFDRLLATVMGDDLTHHERSSYAHIGGEWVPYPVQHNLHRMPPEMASDALEGLIEVQLTGPTHRPPGDGAEASFEDWMAAVFGPGLTRHFMRPYNEKVWAYPPSQMASHWMAERVPTIDWRQALRSVVSRQDHVSWGPNNTFAFPNAGGTGEIYRRAAQSIDNHIRYRSHVTAVDPITHTIAQSNGDVVEYNDLVWTGPLDQLIASIADVPPAVRDATESLVHNSVTIVGIGYETPLADDRSWLYFPDDDVPFYRATNFAKYAAANVPESRTDIYSSWMTEIASSPWHPIELNGLGERVDEALRTVGLVPVDATTASVHIDHLTYGYPVPTLDRDRALGIIQPWLANHGIYSRGRFGAWLYELGNMDHAVKMGIDVARRIVTGQPEDAWERLT